jgi:hypothetical protein
MAPTPGDEKRRLLRIHKHRGRLTESENDGSNGE